MPIFSLLLVGSGGFLGSIARYLVYLGIKHFFTLTLFPLATLTVNVVGCLLISILLTLNEKLPHGVLAFEHQLIPLIGVGFLGAFTTFSALGFETIQLLRFNHPKLALLNVLLNLLLGFMAIALGRWLTLCYLAKS